MITIGGSYLLRGKHKIFSFEVAKSWEELNPQQYAHILQILTYVKADPFTLQASLLSILCQQENFHIISNLEEDLVTGLLPLLDFIFNTRPPVINKFQSLTIGEKTYHAPADDLSNIGFGEWCFAYQFYQLYFEFKAEEYLNQLIACLYRVADPAQTEDNPNFTGDIRQKFNENLIDKQISAFATIDEHVKHAILVWFSSALLQVMDRRPNVFPPANTEQQPQNEQESKQENPTDWLTIFRELLGPKWGTTEQLKFTNACFVLDGLEDQHIAFKKAKDSAAA